ncbi:hypothetical protein Y032_0556g3382 [Ancylostoma ceylanicum]|uniref:Uncharacterized protein n=1 Tax=Ancylostoma ceylanicum TaxID=53326 RepID=A0A016WRY6_9BILA|nr:hypothetical protein Y032_0556g3382 [Ancylostoma ceylanicum]
MIYEYILSRRINVYRCMAHSNSYYYYDKLLLEIILNPRLRRIRSRPINVLAVAGTLLDQAHQVFPTGVQFRVSTDEPKRPRSVDKMISNSCRAVA